MKLEPGYNNYSFALGDIDGDAHLDLVAASSDTGIEPGLIGVIQADHPRADWACPIQVASVQTLMRRTVPPADIVVIDECHRVFDYHKKWMAQEGWTTVPFVGLSATPWTKGMGKIYDHLIVAARTQELIERGLLSPFRVLAPSHPDLRGVKITAGDFDEQQLASVMGQSKLVADVVETWLAKAEGRPTFVFCVDRAHARAIADKFESAGVATEYMDMNTPREERAAIRERFASGEVRVVCNVGVLTTGIDWDVRCISLARPTRSEILFTQIIGRALRTAPGKDYALILDHSDTTLRLGFVTDIHHDSLDDGKPKPKSAGAKPSKLPKECRQCGFLCAAGAVECPSCGARFRAVKDVTARDGALVEVTKRKNDLATRRAWFMGLRGYAEDKGKPPKWVNGFYYARFNSWPDREWWGDLAVAEPTLEMLGWIKSRNIAYAMNQKKGRIKRLGGLTVTEAWR